MRISVCVAAAAVLFSSAVAMAGPLEDETLAAFEAYCVENINQQSAIPEMLSMLGVQPLESGMAAMLLNGQNGKAWLLNQTSTKMFLALSDKGVCTIYSRDANPVDSRKLFISTFRNKVLRTEPIGSQTEEWFLVTQVNRNGGEDLHVVVITNASTLASMPGMILNAFPESLASELGLSFTEWP